MGCDHWLQDGCTALEGSVAVVVASKGVKSIDTSASRRDFKKLSRFCSSGSDGIDARQVRSNSL